MARGRASLTRGQHNQSHAPLRRIFYYLLNAMPRRLAFPCSLPLFQHSLNFFQISAQHWRAREAHPGVSSREVRLLLMVSLCPEQCDFIEVHAHCIAQPRRSTLSTLTHIHMMGCGAWLARESCVCVCGGHFLTSQMHAWWCIVEPFCTPRRAGREITQACPASLTHTYIINETGFTLLMSDKETGLCGFVIVPVRGLTSSATCPRRPSPSPPAAATLAHTTHPASSQHERRLAVGVRRRRRRPRRRSPHFQQAP
jgi:hypothetical protein